MALGDIYEATAGGTTDLYYLDLEMYDTPRYGCAYILDAERPALVDTGIGRHPDVILEALGEVGIAPADLAVIAPTHVHLDHAGGAGHLADACPNASVYVHEIGARHLVDPERLWEGTKAAVGDEIEFYGHPEPVPADRLVEVADGDVIGLGDHALEVHHAPGHAPHQAVYYDPANDGVFAADAAGINTPDTDGPIETTPPSNFDLEGALDDVEALQELDPDAIYYGHFGDDEAADNLRRYADVLAAWVADVETVWEETRDEAAVVEHFQERTDAVDYWHDRKAMAETSLNVRGVLHYLRDREDA
jgi:glyoxylase-like metal-dependent hydrolase (beta-lactamase superfamily II)